MAGRCDCARPCSCAMQSSDTVTVTGSGSVASPLTAAARLSADACNRLVPGTDGGLFVGVPLLYGPDGATLIADETCGITIPAPCILDYDGNPLTPTEGGCIQLPVNGAPPAYGCGLTSDEEAVLSVEVTADQYEDLTDLAGASFAGTEVNGAPIYCTDDGLRTLPQSTAVAATRGEEVIFGPDLVAVPDSLSTDPNTALTITNDSPARRMQITRFASAIVDLVTAANGGAEVRLQQQIDGGGWTTIKELRWPEPATDGAAIRFRGQITSTRISEIAAASSQVVELRVQIAEDGVGTDYPVLVSVSTTLSMLGVTI